MTQIARLERLMTVPVIPVLTVLDVNSAVPLARALAAGGLHVLEITLRSDAALSAIHQIAGALPSVKVGAGTVRTPEQANAAIAAGAAFLVSPGVTPRLIEASQRWSVPLLPGAATASEAMALADLGFGIQKFFPAGQLGGPAALAALAAPLPDIRFCPTGGITADNAAAYLEQANVICVGGSWVAPRRAVEAEDWAGITELARAASDFRA